MPYFLEFDSRISVRIGAKSSQDFLEVDKVCMTSWMNVMVMESIVLEQESEVIDVSHAEVV